MGCVTQIMLVRFFCGCPEPVKWGSISNISAYLLGCIVVFVDIVFFVELDNSYVDEDPHFSLYIFS